MKSLEKISVVIPVLNGEKCLADCLTSVLQQDVEIHECIIVDNNSTDRTKKIIQEFKKTHSNVVYVFESIRTRGAARNAGINKATGTIIAMTDVDCVVSKDWIRRLTYPIFANGEVAVVGHQYDMSTTYWSRNMQKMIEYSLRLDRGQNGYCSFFDTKNCAIRTKVIKAIPFDSRFKALEDVEIINRLRPTVRFRFLKDVQVGHKHASSMKAVWKVAYERSYWFAQMYHKFKGVYDSNGVLIFSVIPPRRFYWKLAYFNFSAIGEYGSGHLLFFLVFDCAWKIGSAVGYARPGKILDIHS